jgi:DNA-binding transcriptional ArsR family regulator
MHRKTGLDKITNTYITGFMVIKSIPPTIEEMSQGFAAMGSESRLGVLLTLVKAGNSGLSVGDIQAQTGIPASTLAHHLRFLASANLVEQTRVGRSVINRARYEHLQVLADYILRECCADEIDQNA